MKINISNATFSSIVGIGEKIEKIEKSSDRKFLKLNRGVNAVTNIDLTNVVPFLDCNSNDFQLYAPNTGFKSLKKAILTEYDLGEDPSMISVTPGGMPALDLVIQLLNVESVHFPKFYWGSYSKMATIRNKAFSFYDDFLSIDTRKLNDTSCFLVCDPNNPTGVKMPEAKLMEKIMEIQNTGAIVIFDSPYRKLFSYPNLSIIRDCKNVIITESFSKWLGLPGMRLGFIYSNNEEFNRELNIRLLYEFNGVASPSQIIVERLISEDYGRIAIDDFRKKTVDSLRKNISFLKQNEFLPDDIYGSFSPLGIFAIVNKSEDFLLQHDIGSVGLDKFVYYDKDLYSSYSRVCVSVPHEKFKEYFEKIIL